MLAAVLTAGCSGGGHGRTYDGSCASGPAYRSALLGTNATTGAVVWRRSLAHPREDRPEVTEGHVLLRGCGLDVLDLATGSSVAHRKEERDLLGLAGDRLVTSSGDGDVRAEPWTGGGGFVGGSTPPWEDVALVGRLLLAGEPGSLVAIDVVRGRERWRTGLPTTGLAGLLVEGGGLVVRTDDGSVYRLDAATGVVAWRALPRGAELGYGELLAAGPGTVVVAADETSAGSATTLVGLDLATGAETWRRTMPLAPRTAPPAVAGSTLVVAAAAGVHGLDLATGRDRWQVAAEAVAPVAAAGAVVVDDATSAFGVDPVSGRVLWRRATTHRPLLGAEPGTGLVVVLDSPVVPHGRNDCC